MPAVEIAPRTYWIGTNIYTRELFEGIWPIPNGVSINAYLVKGDDKIALIDLMKSGGGGSSENIISQLKSIDINAHEVDYLILNHLEPDHTGYVSAFHELNPDIQIITSIKGAPLVNAFYSITENVRAVGDGDTLDLGGRELQFYLAPNVHWPETMVTYDPAEKILFPCDAFGSFGALKGYIFDDQVPAEDKAFWKEETLRYYANIVASFSTAVLAAIDKLGALDIKMIAPSHGLIWRTNVGEIIQDYVRYANYMNESEPEITVVWGSMYGNTENIMRAVLRGIASEGVKVSVHKVPETDASFVLADAWKSAGLVIAMPTYEYNIFPPMGYVLDLMKLKHFHHKIVLRVGSFGWVGGAQKVFDEKTKDNKWDIIGPLEYQGAPKVEDLDRAETLGKDLAQRVKEIPPKNGA